MTLLIGAISQKGGVGKSTLVRLVAREYAAAGWNVKIADLDVSQGTSYNWQSRRLQNNVEPVIAVEQFSNIEQALKTASNYDLMLFDGAPHSNAATLKIAQKVDLIILPTGLSLDDLEPTIKLAHELRSNGIAPAKIVMAFCRVGDSEAELDEATRYIEQAGYHALPGSIPERTAYRRASDLGRSVTETNFSSLNKKAEQLAQAVVDIIDKQNKKGAA
jgi:chromosome partitioning protein